MKGKYMIAAGTAVAGLAAYYFVRKRKASPATPPLKEKERHHLTTAFARAKQVAVGK
jgi:LPXTG-motif cell wall-anchored protein